MRRLFAVGMLCLLPTMALAQELTETQKLQAENFRLKVQVLQLQKQLSEAQIQFTVASLNGEKTALETSFKATLKPAEGATFDWETLTFKAPPTPTTPNGKK